MSWVTELLTRQYFQLDCHYTMAGFPASLFQALIDMRNDDAHTVRLWQEILCNNGENEAWLGIFKLK